MDSEDKIRWTVRTKSGGQDKIRTKSAEHSGQNQVYSKDKNEVDSQDKIR